MSDTTHTPAPCCPSCGAQMRVDALAGLCPACLFAGAADPISDLSERLTTMSPPNGLGIPASMPLVPGQLFGSYRIVRRLGRGGMGDVYEAEQREQGRRVALKVLRQRITDSHDRARFLREGQLAASINHPNSVYIFGSDVVDGTSVIAMELLAGGTLNDRVRDRGPLPPVEAVDAILQMIAGLDAAQAGGVLHRDIKPANCFVDLDGTVKIGDFGLSISTVARDVTPLTQRGTFQGTPQFAAPEQLRGEPLDVRADIYAVGSTLYYLLTGRPPFDDTDLMALVTRIATQVPRSPRALQPRVPSGLATIVLECLGKDRASRPSTYAALDDALRPFGSAAPTAAPPGSRIAASLIDQLLFMFAFSLVRAVIEPASIIASVSPFLPEVMMMAAYFTLTEGLAGASAGKWILGLRVTDVDGGRPGLIRGFIRTTIFLCARVGPSLIPASQLARVLVPGGGLDLLRNQNATIWSFQIAAMLPLVAPLALFLVARPRHGFAGLHDLLSGTRVTRDSSAPRPSASWNALRDRFDAREPTATAPDLMTCGPFVLSQSLWSTASSSLWLGFDPVLKRQVWIRQTAGDADLSDAARRNLARPGRLRWLAGQRRSSGSWEAFERPRGASLLTLVAVKQPWTMTRQWLADLSEELAMCQRAGELPALGLDRVWITSDGRARLLDFPVSGGVPPIPAVHGDAQDHEARTKAYLADVAWSALRGRAQTATDTLPIMQPPLPLSGTAVLRELRHPRTGDRLEQLLHLCRAALQTPSKVPRRIRALVPALIAAVLALLAASISMTSARFGVSSGVGTEEQALFNSLASIGRLPRSVGPEAGSERWALEVYIVGRYAPLSSRGASFNGGLRPFRRLADEIAARRPAVSNTDLAEALKVLGRDRLERLNQRDPTEAALGSVLLTVYFLLPLVAGFAYLSLVLAFAFRGGLILRLFQIAVVDAAGNEVSRWRALGRAIVTWLPVIVLQFSADWTTMTLGAIAGVWAILGAVCLITVVGTAWAVMVPERGLQDLIAGTWLVPR